MKLPELLLAVWKSFLYDGFPRLLGVPNSKEYEEEEFFRQLWKHIGWCDIYASLFNSNDIRKEIANKVYIDIDYKVNLYVAYKVKNKLSEYISNKYGVIPRQVFTGNKGFTFYLDFEPMKIDNYTFTIKYFITDLCKKCGLLNYQEIVDFGVLNRNRITRIPFTKNIKSGRMCIPIKQTDSFREILQKSKNCEPIIIEKQIFGKELTDYLHEIDTVRFKEYDAIKEQEKVDLPFSTEGYANDLNLLLKFAPHINNGRKRLLMAMIIPRMVTLGATNDYIFNYCQTFLELTGVNYKDYQAYILAQINNKRQLKKNISWGWSAFFKWYPELLPLFQKV